ncbi:serine hydrolase [Novosphingobium sp. FSY-8]|uniref:Serine hydrolase n=1 Tax=Novosphingobium ovatum TaxID=1908523 RepID=A0ABW9XBW3_9SPHN|nr:serine hydrolase domain-containing protein [Novosphingobium ovatum]NBC36003.1 serine hydrolase [Novosphingobium ovatum]
MRSALLSAGAAGLALGGAAAAPARPAAQPARPVVTPLTPAPIPANAEAIYMQRYRDYMKTPGDFPYNPMEAMPGVETYRALPTATSRALPAKVLDQAAAYAAQMGSRAMLVWHKGVVVKSWYAPGMGTATQMVSKSLSKPLTGIAVGRAIALGYIPSLDTPLSQILPETAGKPQGRILVRHLLDMRSGMLDQGFTMDPAHPLNRAYLELDHGPYTMAHYPMIAEPGARYGYANAPSDMVAYVIERATGRRYGEFISNEVLRPIGAQGGSIWVDRPGGLAHSGCCTYLPTETYLRMGILLLKDGVWGGPNGQKRRLLPTGYVSEMRKGTPQNPNFGLGIWIGEPYLQRRGFGAQGAAGPKVLHSAPFLDPKLFMFDGNGNQVVWISPKADLIVMRLGAAPPAPSATQPEWDNAYLPNLLLGALGLKPAPAAK